jgi:hypothetical protein
VGRRTESWRKHRNANWTVYRELGGRVSHDDAELCVLLDIREELKRLNTLLHCENFMSLPDVMRGVRANTTTIKRLLKEQAEKNG